MDTIHLTLHGTPDGVVAGARTDHGAPMLRWSGAWTSLGGIAASAPATCTDGHGWLWAFVRGEDGRIHANVRKGLLGWSGWQPIPGQPVASSPSACLDPEGRVAVFARGEDGAVWHTWWEADAWSAWTSLEGQILHSPIAMRDSLGHLVVYVIGTDRALWHRYRGAGAWSPWISLGGVLTSAPAVAEDAVGRVHVFGRGIDDALYYRMHEMGWQPWTSLGGGLSSAPAAAVDPDGVLRVRVVGTDRRTVFERACAGGWDPWVVVDALPVGVPDPHHADDEAMRRLRDRLRADPEVLQLASTAFDAVRLMLARAVLSVAEPDRVAPSDPYEQAIVDRLRARPPADWTRAVSVARAAVDTFDPARTSTPDLWEGFRPRGIDPVPRRLAARPWLTPDAALALERRLGSGLIPQSGENAELRILSIRCVEETDEVGDDTILLSAVATSPSGSVVALGPHDLGDFETGTVRHYDITDGRMTYRWRGEVSSAERPYSYVMMLTERDGDVDQAVFVALGGVVQALAGVGAAATGGVWAPLITVAAEVAWELIVLWWKDATLDELAPPIVLHGWAGMDGANAPRTTWVDFDGGQYHITYVWSPPEVPIPLPPQPAPTDFEVELVDRGPYVEIGATGAPFGLWARRWDGRVLFRDSWSAPAVPIEGPAARALSDGWALIEGGAGEFDFADRRFETRMSMSNRQAVSLEQVSGTPGGPTWALAKGRPLRLRRTKGVAVFWTWAEVPAPEQLTRIWTGPTERVWAQGESGSFYEWSSATGTFERRTVDFIPVGVSPGPTWTYAWTGGGELRALRDGQWTPIRPIVRRGGARDVVPVRQVEVVEKPSAGIATITYVLGADGAIYARSVRAVG